MRRTLTALAAGLIFAAGCSKASTTQGPRSSSNVITRQEIETVVDMNLYDAIQRLRPSFFRARATATTGSGSSNPYPVVFVDGQRRGNLEYLRAIPSREVAEVRYISAVDATTRYGMNVEAGVLDVKLIGRY